jgi:predicted nuclease of predicted toxin-antitoxin system
MKLLFDQNISFRILPFLKDGFPDVIQVRVSGLENATDIEIWQYARKHDFCIVTFDADFIDISTLKGHPPKIIWLRFGNTTTKSIAHTLMDNKDIIISFLNDQEIAFLEIHSSIS